MSRKVSSSAATTPRTIRKASNPYAKCIIWIVVTCVGVTLSFHLYQIYGAYFQKSLPCKLDQSVAVDGRVDEDNEVFISKDNVTYPKGSFFRAGGHTRVCQCLDKPCIRKCCNATQALEENSPICVEVAETEFMSTERKLYKIEDESSIIYDSVFSSSRFNILYGDVCSNSKFLLNHSANPEDVSYLKTDGSLYLLNNHYETNSYCLENFVGDSETYTIICFNSDQSEENEPTFAIYPTGMIISEPFLLLTFLVYSCLPGLQNLHGKSLMCYVSTLFFGYLFLSIVQIANSSISVEDCIIFGKYIFYCFYLFYSKT